MSKIQTWTIVFLFGVLTFAACWHFYRMDQYRQEQLSIERVGLGRALNKDIFTLYRIPSVHSFIKHDMKIFSERNNPPPPPKPPPQKLEDDGAHFIKPIGLEIDPKAQPPRIVGMRLSDEERTPSVTPAPPAGNAGR
ncbi:MAG: hypothetical protein BWX54_02157 [Verrucomicrobia bacterium ADurb.Bin018]|jgi:hypothetical protein|nr:MAG: hypothetical protein BWX54_02157 [Verrucomicrobia bacterium ADurb.Bin018]